MIAFWLWDILPSMVAATVFGMVAVGLWLSFLWRRNRLLVTRVGALIAASGGVLNLLALFANGGYMPVLGREEANGMWIPAENPNLPWLIDRFGGFSAGDMFIFSGAGVVIAGVLVHHCVKGLGEAS